MPEILVLDAMGVLYQAGDDVAELLVPFVRAHGNAALTDKAIDDAYMIASRGEISAVDFWQRMAVDPALEDAYLAGHRLIEATRQALPDLKKRYGRIVCLTNDVSDWSLKLRRRFGLETWIDRWFVSGDVGIRKTSPEIYHQALGKLEAQPEELLFVDDRPTNLDVAGSLGIRTILLDAMGGAASSHRTIRTVAELL